MRKVIHGLVLVILSTGTIFAQPRQLELSKPKDPIDIASTMWGIFFEDINFAADGGIYAELIKNRSFEFAQPRMGWTEIRPEHSTSQTLIINRGTEFITNPRFLRLHCREDSTSFILVNEGFRGIGIQADETYNFSMLARVSTPGIMTLNLRLVDSNGVLLGESAITQWPKDWQKVNATIQARSTCPKGKLQLCWTGQGTVDMDMISLFPTHTWFGRPNGLRSDLVQKLADLKPGFIRFPGGCIVEGRDLANRYQWKKTVGPIEERTVMINRWNNEFKHQDAPDYFQSFGLGFYEYFQLAEDLGAEPLPIVNCGMACQFNTGEVVPAEDLDQYIQDALDLIEFANGSATNTSWGRLRATMGHPQPFRLKMIGIGNEQWEDQYFERYAAMAKAIKTKYPEIRLIGSSGPFRAGEWFDKAWTAFDTMPVDFIDEHYYSPPEWFLKNANRYDTYNRTGPLVFAGEYAGHDKSGSEEMSRNTWLSALSEAAFMTGLERNADVVRMASYAPLLAHMDAWQWRPDLLWFDNLNTYITPNYLVQKIFANYKGHQVLNLMENGAALSGQTHLYASAVLDTLWGEIYLKLVNTIDAPQEVKINHAQSYKGAKVVHVTRLHHAALEAYNSTTQPVNIQPEETTVRMDLRMQTLILAPRSLTLIRFKQNK